MQKKKRKICNEGSEALTILSLSRKPRRSLFFPFRSFALCASPLSVHSFPLRSRNRFSSLLPFRKEVNRRTMPDIPAGKEGRRMGEIARRFFFPPSRRTQIKRGRRKTLPPRSPCISENLNLSSARRLDAPCRARCGSRRKASEPREALSQRRCETKQQQAKRALFLFFIELSLTSSPSLSLCLSARFPPRNHSKQASTSAGAMTGPPPRAPRSSQPPPPARPGEETSRPSPRGSSPASSRASARTSSRRRATSLRRRTLCTRRS